MISIQKMMRTTLSVRVSDFTMTSEMPKANAAPSTTRCPGSILSRPGPNDDDDADQAERDRGDPRARQPFPRNATASIAVQIGVVNSIEISSPSGISVSA